MALKIEVQVELDDGRRLVAVTDQRDFAAAEAEAIGRESQANTWVRYVAWHALARVKAYGGTWPEFNTTDCVEASDVPTTQEVPAGDDEGLDPGRRTSTGGS